MFYEVGSVLRFPLSFLIMKRFTNNQCFTISKDWLLTRVNQEDIFARFMSLSLNTIYQCIGSSKKVTSFFRGDDTNSSMGFTKNRQGKVVCRDFGGYFWGDCFDLVGWCYNLDTKSKQDFIKILSIIYKEFNIMDGNKVAIVDVPKRHRKLIVPIICDWSEKYSEFWIRAGITYEVVKQLKIYPVSKVYINNFLYLDTEKTKGIAFAYYSGEEDGIHLWKIYCPYSKGNKFIANHYNVDIFNRGYDTALIIKSRKDLASIIPYTDYDFTAYVLAGEGQRFTEAQIEYVKQNHRLIYTFSDGDRAGLLMAKWYRGRLNSIPLFYRGLNSVKDNYDFAICHNELLPNLIEEVRKIKHSGKRYANQSIMEIFDTIPKLHTDLPF